MNEGARQNPALKLIGCSVLVLASLLAPIAVHAATSDLFVSSSGNVGIGTTSPNSGAALDIGNTTSSLLLPVGTSGNRPSGVGGMLRYNSASGAPEFFTTGWLPVPLTASSPIVIDATTGNLTCPTCNTSSAAVASVSGDGTLISNSASTGAVALTLGNASAYSVWGNATSSSAVPGYTSSPTLSGIITDTQTIGASTTDGLVLTNPTAASSGNQQWSPRVRWTGRGWKTDTTAASQELDAVAELQAVQGTSSPTFNWVLSGQVNGGGYTPLLTVPSSGGLNISSGVYQIGGAQIAASNLANGTTGSGAIVLATSPTLTTPNIGAATGTSLAVSGNITTSAGSIGVGTTAPNSGSAIDMSKTSSSVLLPVGTSGDRPTGVDGMMRYNSDTPGIEVYYSSAWHALSAASSTGTVASIQTFTSSGTWSKPSGLGTDSMTYLQCWGAGGGGNVGGGDAGGGGGAYRDVWVKTSTLSSSVSVTIGSGGTSGGNGGASSFGSSLTAPGGGGGGSGASPAGTGGDYLYGQYYGGGCGETLPSSCNTTSSIYGGGGGGHFGSGTSGSSAFGGSGGKNGIAGSQPGGGGGNGAAGGAGECKATTWY
jgi:hypothetical protein